MPVLTVPWGTRASSQCHSDHSPSPQASRPRCWGWFRREETSLKHSPSPNHLQQGNSPVGHHCFVTSSSFLLPEPALLPVEAMVPSTPRPCWQPSWELPAAHIWPQLAASPSGRSSRQRGTGGFPTPAALRGAEEYSFVWVSLIDPAKL